MKGGIEMPSASTSGGDRHHYPGRRRRSGYEEILSASEHDDDDDEVGGEEEDVGFGRSDDDDAYEAERRGIVRRDDRDHDDDHHNGSRTDRVLLDRTELLSLSLTTTLTVSTAVVSPVPVVLLCRDVIYDLFDRWYFALPVAALYAAQALSAALVLFAASHAMDAGGGSPTNGDDDDGYNDNDNDGYDEGSIAGGKRRPRRRRRLLLSRLALSFAALISAVWFPIRAVLVPRLYVAFRDSFFLDLDGTVAVEWSDLERTARIATIWSVVASALDLAVFVLAALLLREDCRRQRDLRKRREGDGERPSRVGLSRSRYESLRSRKFIRLHRTLGILALAAAAAFLAVCSESAGTFLLGDGSTAASVRSTVGPECDPMDDTECLFPFPSNFFTRADNTTATGLRVDIPVEALSTLYKGNGPVHPSFLNEMDGFSTLAPALFYLEGLKEGGGLGHGGKFLPGPDRIDASVTSRSVTALVDVERAELVPHFAEIDRMDEDRPCVVLQPAAPLRHGAEYAVALTDAIGEDGERLRPSPFLGRLLSLGWEKNAGSDEDGGSGGVDADADTDTDGAAAVKVRARRFANTLLPALARAAPWLDNVPDTADADPSSLQMLFEFRTASAESQLGLTRSAVRGALRDVEAEGWGGWGEHNVRVVKTIDGTCAGPDDLIARVVHGEVDVPWFLHVDNPRHRASFFDMDALEGGSLRVLPVKFVAMVPCSLVNDTNSTKLKAVVDFGHGLLYSREELLHCHFLHRIANDNGYLLVATNWRGMSELDLPVVLRTFIAQPNLFKAGRDNLIQGYADKAALQHFYRNGLLGMDFLTFEGKKQIVLESNEPKFIFYGISQGGILGSAYSSLMGPSQLIDRSILGSPGTPFALLMSRSDIFPFYRALLSLNLSHLRHVRIFITLIQMAYDSVESAGVLAPPLTEPFPRTLIQAGLGDSTVTTYGTEIMARAFNASIFPDNPRKVFGLAIEPGANSTWRGPLSALTEVVYVQENASIPISNNGSKHNHVHWCVRLDAALQRQLVSFVNDGNIIDPCLEDGCIRPNATCW